MSSDDAGGAAPEIVEDAAAAAEGDAGPDNTAAADADTQDELVDDVDAGAEFEGGEPQESLLDALDFDDDSDDGPTRAELAAQKAEEERLAAEAAKAAAVAAAAVRAEKAAAKAAADALNGDDNFDWGDATPLVQAIFQGDNKEIQRLVSSLSLADRCDYVNRVDSTGMTPIFYALHPSMYTTLETLLQYGADPSVKNFDNNTPLHLCSKAHERSLIRLLIEYGADPSVRNKEAKQPHEMHEEQTDVDEMLLFIDTCVEHRGIMLRQQMLVETTSEQRIYYKQLFDSLDLDQDGVLSLDDIRRSLAQWIPAAELYGLKPDKKKKKKKKVNSKKLGARDPNMPEPTPHDIIEFFKWFDVEKDGVITFRRFLRDIAIHFELSNLEGAKAKAKQLRAARRKAKAKKKAQEEADRQKRYQMKMPTLPSE